MSGARIKSLVIVVLVLINAAFLTVIIIDNITDARSLRESVENVCSIMQSNGIMIVPDNVRTGSAIRTMRTSRVPEAEEAVAYAVLGSASVLDEGVIYTYENAERGTAKFYTAGDFEIHLIAGAITSTDDTLGTVQGLVRNMKLEAIIYNHSPGEDGETVTALCTYRGASIFNCTIDFIFSNGSLSAITGRYVAGIEPAENGAELSQVGTALLGFLAAVKRGDIECAYIGSVEAGYQYRVVGSFGEIAPAWMLDTDTGRYIIDAETGEIRAIS